MPYMYYIIFNTLVVSYIYPCQLDEMMRWGDKDGDGKVGAQEFSAMMMELMRKHLADRSREAK